jgi:hypothetical protein
VLGRGRMKCKQEGEVVHHKRQEQQKSVELLAV